MANPRRERRDVAALEARRFEAAQLFGRGQSQAAVMRAFEVSRQTAHRWYHAWHQQGRTGLKAAGRLGRKPRLDRRQLARLELALLRGPRRHGFATELWSLPGVAVRSARPIGVRYPASRLSYVLLRLS